MPFLHSDERQPESIKPIYTLNITIEHDIEIPDSLNESHDTPSSANTIVQPFIDPAFVAYKNFIEAYRDVKYLADRGTQRWHDQQGVLVSLPSWNDFVTYLFYVLNTPRGLTFVGCFSEGKLLGVQLNDATLQQQIQQTLQKGVPLSRMLLCNAWEALFQGDMRSSVIWSAATVELILSQLVRSELKKRKSGSAKQISAFIRETSNRLLATVVLDVLNLGDDGLRTEAVQVFEVRNALLHNSKRDSSYEEARRAAETAAAFLQLADR